MSWATRTTSTMDNGSRPLDPAMLEPVEVRALVAFGLGEKLVAAGEIVVMPRHRAEYARFLGLVDDANVL